jgi:hypothetical protein
VDEPKYGCNYPARSTGVPPRYGNWRARHRRVSAPVWHVARRQRPAKPDPAVQRNRVGLRWRVNGVYPGM